MVAIKNLYIENNHVLFKTYVFVFMMYSILFNLHMVAAWIKVKNPPITQNALEAFWITECQETEESLMVSIKRGS